MIYSVTTRLRNSKRQMANAKLTHSEQSDWFQEVIDYATSAVNGKKLACKSEIAACQRFFDDFERFKTNPDYEYAFDFEKAYRPIRFIELLPHVKGHFAAQIGKHRLIQLQPWQKFTIANLFGWVLKTTNLRRFNAAYIEVPRKNGKSVLAAGIGLYMLCADGEVGAEVYCGAGSLKQADEVFQPALKMVRKTPALRKAFRIVHQTKSIRLPDGSKFEPVIGKPGDGASPSLAIVDEYHEHPTADLYDTMVTGMGARQQPLILVITTSGENLFSPCYDMHKDAVRMLDGLMKWPQLFAMIYGLDEGDDWTDPQMLIKANPNYGVSVGPDFIKAQQNLAKIKTNKQNSFKTKHLNVWCYAKNAYFNLLNWQNCHDPDMNIDHFQGEICWIGLDLAKKRDLSAKIIIFKEHRAGFDHYFIFTRFYLPEMTITDQENDTLATLYTDWLNAGYIQTCTGNEMDFSMIRDDVIDDSEAFHVEEVPHDPHGAIHISHELVAAGLLPVSMPQHGSTYTAPINELEAAIDSGRIHHDGNPVMAWCIANTIVHEYKGGNKMPDKADNDSKIDGVSALLMALNRAMSIQIEEEAGMIIL
jgi:phage terminase large subunit-like protein